MPSPSAPDVTRYRLAPALVARLVGRGLVAVGVLVLVATLIAAWAGAGWALVAGLALLGVALVGVQAWWRSRRAWVVRLTPEGDAVRLLQRVGARGAPWSEVTEAVAASPRGEPCLVIRLGDGRATVLPVAALAGDREVLAHDVRRRLRDAHSDLDGDHPDSAGEPDSL